MAITDPAGKPSINVNDPVTGYVSLAQQPPPPQPQPTDIHAFKQAMGDDSNNNWSSSSTDPK
jgi:hypothetical protein